MLWRDEWHTWLLDRSAPDVAAIFPHLRYDGHPALWYLIVWLATRLSSDVVAMKVAHAAIATATVFVVALAAPFSRGWRACIACGYFFAFEYAAISRNYGLGVLFLLIATAIVARRPRSYVAFAVALALAVQSNAFAALVTLVFATWVLIEWWREGRPFARRFAAGACVLIVSLSFAAWTTRPAPDLANSPAMFDVNVGRLLRIVAFVWRTFVPLPSITRAWWESNLLDVHSSLRSTRVIQGTLGVACFALLVLVLPQRRGARTLFVMGVGVLVAFSYVKIAGSLRHYGHFYVLFLSAIWIGTPDDASNRDSSPAWRRRCIGGVLLVQAFAGVVASFVDWQLPFSASRAIGEFINDRYPSAAVLGHIDYSTSPIAGVIDRPLYFPISGRWGSFLIWDQQRDRDLSKIDLVAAARRVRVELPGRPVLLVLSHDVRRTPDPNAFREIASFDDSSIATETYTLYEFVEPVRP